MTPPTVLTVAGFDPSSGAGITADLAVFAAHGLNGISAITALTVQSTLGVRSSHPVDASVLRSTLECLDQDLPAQGVKIGMLASAPTVRAVAGHLAEMKEKRPGTIVVLDPVLRSSSGRELVDQAGLAIVLKDLLPHVDWITPNLDELSILAGVHVAGRGDVPGAVSQLQARYPHLGVFATGGHLDPPDDYLMRGVADETPGTWLPGTRVLTRATHGTGCALSSAFLCSLIQQFPAEVAAANAKRYVRGAMENAFESGTGPCAMNLFWALRRD